MTGNQVAERAATLRKSVEQPAEGIPHADADVYLQILALVEALAVQVSTLDGSQTIQFRTTPDGQTF